MTRQRSPPRISGDVEINVTGVEGGCMSSGRQSGQQTGSKRLKSARLNHAESDHEQSEKLHE
jgi:hypothetical protein